jgi:hypothetical protein
MSILWTNPAAWWGLAALLVPIAIHLLVRYRSTRVPFPSLRFLRSTRLAAFHQRVIADWPLLAVRLLILAAAVAALAGPVLVTEYHRTSWNARVARAFVVLGDAAEKREIARIVEEEGRGSHATAVFPTIVDAASWLSRQAPAAREIVFVGDLRAGRITDADVTAIPPHVGVRFLPIPDARAQEAVRLAGISAGAGQKATPYQVDVQIGPQTNRLRYAASASDAGPSVVVRAGSADQTYAEAVLAAVLAEGVLWGRSTSRSVQIRFAGAPADGEVSSPARQAWMRDVLARLPEITGGDSAGQLIVVSEMSVRDPAAPRLVARVLNEVFAESLDALAAAPIPATVLAGWSRPPGSSPPDVQPADEGDRRWLWAAALALLMLETVMRGGPTRARPSASATERPASEDVRVA